MMKSVLGALAVVSVGFMFSACDQAPPTGETKQAILNGYPITYPNDSVEWNAQVNVGVPGDEYLCSGVLLNSDWLLTAAHCFENGGGQIAYGAANVTVYAFSSADGSGHSASAVYIHPQYNNTVTPHFRDMALVKLTTPVVFTMHQFWNMPMTSNGAGSTASIVNCYGMGQTKSEVEGDGSAGLVLATGQMASQPLNTPTQTFTVWPGQYGQLLAPGDSGGPCLVGTGNSAELAGIAQSVITDYYGTYTGVVTALDLAWINSVYTKVFYFPVHLPL